MHALRYLTLVWPGLPWLWLRGSVSGLVLALAFAVSVDVAILATFVWPGLVELRLTVGLWAAVAAIHAAATVSAVASFPPPLVEPRRDEAEALFALGRDAYLARDWSQAEIRLHELLDLDPTDGEAQLLYASLLRRTGRVAEATKALEKLARSDSGVPWRHEIAAEVARLAGPAREETEDASTGGPLAGECRRPSTRSAAA